jgi:hypothetical protein
MKKTTMKKPMRAFAVTFKCGTTVMLERYSLQKAAFEAGKLSGLRPIDVVGVVEIPR